MKPDYRYILSKAVRVVTLLTAFCLCGIVTVLRADTISPPVSVAIPTGMVGNMTSQSVSVTIADGMVGGMSSRPVSVKFLAGIADSSYLGQPVSVAFQSGSLLDPDLVGLWHMDGDWGDSSGYHNHAEAYNGAAFGDTRVAGSYAGSFDGSDDYLQGTTEFPLGSSARTLLAWIKTDKTDGEQVVFYYGTGSISAPLANFQLIVKDGKAGVGTGSELIATDFSVTDGNWHLLTGVYEGPATNVARIYVDGIERNSGVITAPATVAQSFTMGRLPSGGSPFNGLMDEVHLYKRALTGEEIAYRHGAGTSDPNAPAAPTLNPLPAVVGSPSIVLSGTKPAGTSIWVNGKKIVARDSLTTWQGTYEPLLPGNNILEVTAMDAAGRVGLPTTVVVFYDSVPPEPPVIDPVQSPTTQTSQTITGTREAGTSIAVTCSTAVVGTVTYPTDTTWSVVVTELDEGENTVTATATDDAGHSANASAIIVVTGAVKPGDCDGNSQVSITEVQGAINMYLGLKAVDACVDVDGNGAVSITEVQKAINGYLGL